MDVGCGSGIERVDNDIMIPRCIFPMLALRCDPIIRGGEA